MKGFDEALAGLVVSVGGWLICMGMLIGAFWLGFAFARWTGATELAPMFGLLSAITLIWMYEREEAQKRWDRLNTRLDRLWEKAAGLD